MHHFLRPKEILSKVFNFDLILFLWNRISISCYNKENELLITFVQLLKTHLEPSKIKLFHFCKKGKTFVIYYGWICKAGSVYLEIISRPQRITIAFQKAKLPPKKWSKNWQFPLLFSCSFLDKDPNENFGYIFQTIVTFHFSETPFLTC